MAYDKEKYDREAQLARSQKMHNKRKAEKLCIECATKPVTRYARGALSVRCAECREKRRVEQLSRRSGLRKQNLCQHCGKSSVDSTGVARIRCVECNKDFLCRLAVHRKKLRDEVYQAYGGYTCKCCGQTKDYRFMQLDHINNDGAKHREQIGYGSKIYHWLKKNNYPNIVQVVCSDCHAAKSWHGGCPCKEQQVNNYTPTDWLLY